MADWDNWKLDSEVVFDLVTLRPRTKEGWIKAKLTEISSVIERRALTFDLLLDYIARSDPFIKGKPISNDDINYCMEVVSNHILQYDDGSQETHKECLAAVLKLLIAMTTVEIVVGDLDIEPPKGLEQCENALIAETSKFFEEDFAREVVLGVTREYSRHIAESLHIEDEHTLREIIDRDYLKDHHIRHLGDAVNAKLASSNQQIRLNGRLPIEFQSPKVTAYFQRYEEEPDVLVLRLEIIDEEMVDFGEIFELELEIEGARLSNIELGGITITKKILNDLLEDLQNDQLRVRTNTEDFLLFLDDNLVPIAESGSRNRALAYWASFAVSKSKLFSRNNMTHYLHNAFLDLAV